MPDATAVVPNGSDDAKFASNPFDFDDDLAPGNNDQRHRLVVSGLWDLSYWRDASGWKKGLLDGWSLGWITTWQTGQFDRDNFNAQRNVFYNYNTATNLLIPLTNFGDDIGTSDNRIVQLAAKITF